MDADDQCGPTCERSTLLACLWNLAERDPARAVEHVTRRLTERRLALCGCLRDVSPDVVAAATRAA
ncbi:MAG: hypothetical protein H6704_24635 [Myxococcales bacterium]|nr:hypothetical protein [Myxococcales bacterium]MCB9539413.1 hypothetical protein [Myxococcales bacterium]